MDMKETQTSQAKTMVVDDLQENRKAARKKRSPFSIIFEVLLYVAIIVYIGYHCTCCFTYHRTRR